MPANGEIIDINGLGLGGFGVRPHGIKGCSPSMVAGYRGEFPGYCIIFANYMQRLLSNPADIEVSNDS